MQDTQPHRRPRQAQAQRVRRSAPKVRQPINWRRRIGLVAIILVARSVRQQRVLSAIRGEVTGWQTLSKGMALADALGDHMHTNLPVVDLAMLAGRLTPDRRIELHEDEILQATTNTIGQYVLIPIGQRASDDYLPLHEFVAAQLAEPVEPGEPSTSTGAP